MRIAVCEDDHALCQQIQELLHSRGYIVKTYHSADSLWFDCQDPPHPFDLILLDIQLPGALNGLDLARNIRAQHSEVDIIFMTSYREFAFEGYEARPFQFLIKPVNLEQLLALVAQVERRLILHWDKSLNLSHAGGLIRLPFDRIVYIESSNHQIVVRCVDHNLTVRKKLSDVASLCDSRFFLPHKSFLVNIDHISRIEQNTRIIMSDGSQVPISKHKKNQFVTALAQYDALFSST